MKVDFPGKPGVRETEGFALGRQMTVEFYDCAPDRLADADAMEKIFLDAAKRSGATVIESRFHQFLPQGVSGVVVISESHFAVHAWPEHEYAAVDLFTCGESVDFDKAVEVIAQGLGCKDWIISGLISRGIVGNNGIERVVPVEAKQGSGIFQLSWKRRFEETNAHAISCAMDIFNCQAFDFEAPEAAEDFVRKFLGSVGLKAQNSFSLHPCQEGGREFVQILESGLLSGFIPDDTKTVCLDLFAKGFFDPRKAAETAVGILGGSYYRMQPQVRRRQ